MSLKWAVPHLQEQEARHGFYVYTAAAAADSAPRPSLQLPCAGESAAAQSPRCPAIPRVQSSVDEFFAALEVSCRVHHLFISKTCCLVEETLQALQETGAAQ